ERTRSQTRSSSWRTLFCSRPRTPAAPHEHAGVACSQRQKIILILMQRSSTMCALENRLGWLRALHCPRIWEEELGHENSRIQDIARGAEHSTAGEYGCLCSGCPARKIEGPRGPGRGIHVCGWNRLWPRTAYDQAGGRRSSDLDRQLWVYIPPGNRFA